MLYVVNYNILAEYPQPNVCVCEYNNAYAEQQPCMNKLGMWFSVKTHTHIIYTHIRKLNDSSK